MCKSCGCGKPRGARRGASGTAQEHTHTHVHEGHRHVHTHSHEGGKHKHRHESLHAEAAAARRVVVEQKVLARNDEIAEKNRRWLADRGVVAVNLISSPGSGKTTLLEETLDKLARELGIAVITGDQQTDNDARRLRGRGAPVHQIETISACHLDAGQIAAALPKVIKRGTRLLFIENVGNLVCPAAFDLGEHVKIALLSSAEGEDKPVKYPVLFSEAAAVVLSKMDLVPHLDWDLATCRRCLRQVQPKIRIIELSARTGEGMEAWFDYLRGLVA